MIAPVVATAAAPVYANMPDEIAVQALHNFGACAVARSPRGARELLARDYVARDYEGRMKQFVQGHDYCIPFAGRMSSSPVLFAGAIAEALLKTDVKSADLPERLAFDPRREMIVAHGPAEAMALCTVLNAPQQAVKLFGTEPATPEESAAMKPLDGVLTDCLKKGAQVAVNKPALRSLLALAAWRIVTTPRKPAS